MELTQPPLRVLLADDDAGIRRLLVLLFTRRGWNVVVHVDGQHVADEMASVNPDVLVLDLMMPAVSGFEVLQRLQTRNPACLKRIIVLTAASTSTLRSLTCESEVWAVIRKPFDNAQLLDSIEKCGRSNRSAARMGDLAAALPRHSESMQ